MSDKKNFQVKNGLSINGQQVIDANANATFGAVVVSGRNLLDYTQSVYNTANGANGMAVGAYNQANTNATNISIIQGVDSWQNTQITAVNNFAQGAYNSSNTNATNISIIQGVDSWQNTQITAVNNFAQGAYNQGNTAFSYACTAITWASNADSKAQAAFNKANSANSLAQSAFDKANTDATNITYVNQFAQSSYNQANGANGMAVGAYNQANTNATNITYVNQFAQGAYDTANGVNSVASEAFNKANNALANTTGIFDGSLTTTGNVQIGFLSTGSTQTLTETDGLVYWNVFTEGEFYTLELSTSAESLADTSISALGIGSVVTLLPLEGEGTTVTINDTLGWSEGVYSFDITAAPTDMGYSISLGVAGTPSVTIKSNTITFKNPVGDVIVVGNNAVKISESQISVLDTNSDGLALNYNGFSLSKINTSAGGAIGIRGYNAPYQIVASVGIREIIQPRVYDAGSSNYYINLVDRSSRTQLTVNNTIISANTAAMNNFGDEVMPFSIHLMPHPDNDISFSFDSYFVGRGVELPTKIKAGSHIYVEGYYSDLDNKFYVLDVKNEGTPVAMYNANTSSTGYFAIPQGTSAQRPAKPQPGAIRFNTSNNVTEIYSGTAWTVITSQNYTISYLAVGGGGGATGGTGGINYGSGGAGGVLRTGTFIVSGGTYYTVTVGAAGAGGLGGGANGGTSSITNGTSATGGGGAGTGSGGASNADYSGGSGSGGPAAAGGGAGAGGSASTISGGVGAVSALSGSSTYYGGGGGGSYAGQPGPGGSGGGGPGSNGQGTAGTTNSGGGAGGSDSSHYANGGSGVVIVSYPGAQRGTGGTITSSGGYTIHTFTSSGTFIA